MAGKHSLSCCHNIFCAALVLVGINAQQVSNSHAPRWCAIVGYAMVDTRIRRNATVDQGECHRLCEADPVCESTNYIPSSGQCELNAASRCNCPRDFRPRNESVFASKVRAEVNFSCEMPFVLFCEIIFIGMW